MGALIWMMVALTVLAEDGQPRKVVVGGDADARAALKLAARDAALDPASLELVDLRAELAGLPPVVTGPGSASACNGPPTSASALAETIEDLSRLAIESGGEFGALKAPFAEAEAALGCLDEPVSPEVAANLYLWLGVVNSQTDLSLTTAAFRQMLKFTPEARWKQGMQDIYGRAAFEQARNLEAESFKVLMQVVPPELEDLWVDGRRIDDASRGVQVSPGMHLVQLRSPGEQDVRTLRVTIDGGGVPALVIPAAIPADATSWIHKPDSRKHLSAALAAVFGEDLEILLVSREEVWGGRTGLDDWSLLTRPSMEVPPIARALTWGGGAVAVGSTASMVTLWGLGQRQTTTPEQWDTYRARFQVSEGILYGALATTAAGLAWSIDIRRDRALTISAAPTSSDSALVFVSGMW